jgi:hypothetical protein
LTFHERRPHPLIKTTTGKGFFIKLSAGNDKGVKTAKTTTKSNAPTFDDAPFSITIGNPDSDKLLVGM